VFHGNVRGAKMSAFLKDKRKKQECVLYCPCSDMFEVNLCMLYTNQTCGRL
jgi:hypothetical protein